MTETVSESRSDWGFAARDWWRALQPGLQGRGNRAALARLRRATLLGAMTEEATLTLFADLGFRDPSRLPRVAVTACLLARVREDEPGRTFARAIGRTSLKDTDSAAVSRLRFQRLIEAQGDEEILRGFRRALDLAGNRVDVRDLAWLVLTFDRDETRRRLAFEYYGAGLAAPASAP